VDLVECVGPITFSTREEPPFKRDAMPIDVTPPAFQSRTMAPSTTTPPTALRKIDCIMVRVGDLEKAREFYLRVFGMQPTWRDATSVGLRFPESDAEIVLHNIPDIPARVDVTYLVDNVITAVVALKAEGCNIVEPPFEVAIGKCAVIVDPFGTPMTIIDMTKGPRS
jgi:lactoylglutathione lyase